MAFAPGYWTPFWPPLGQTPSSQQVGREERLSSSDSLLSLSRQWLSNEHTMSFVLQFWTFDLNIGVADIFWAGVRPKLKLEFLSFVTVSWHDRSPYICLLAWTTTKVFFGRDTLTYTHINRDQTFLLSWLLWLRFDCVLAQAMIFSHAAQCQDILCVFDWVLTRNYPENAPNAMEVKS